MPSAPMMVSPFTNFLGGVFFDTIPVLNIFNRELSHLNQMANRMLVIDVTEKDSELEVDAFIGAPKESEFMP